MRAMSLLAVELKEPFVQPHPERAPRMGCYSGDDLTIRVSEWFDKRYGERLKIDMSPGRAVILIRNDPWLVRLPRLMGTWFVVTEDPPDYAPGDFVRATKPGSLPNKLNCLRSVVDLPDALRTSLRIRERAEILSLFEIFFDVFHAMEDLQKDPRSSPLVRQAMSDVDASVEHLIGAGRNAPLAKWSSLQASEKMLKEFIRAKGERFKKLHDLEPLAEHAERLGLPKIPRHSLRAVQCSPGVRYGEENVTVPEAIHAHHVSIKLAGHVAFALGVPAHRRS